MKTGLNRCSFGRFGRTSAHAMPKRLAIESLEARQLLAADLVINELVASNKTTLETHAGKSPELDRVTQPRR